ncbi:MAG: ATP-binding protein [Proteobacteria bacterium]|nr:ATP-binding protein [Pseudomonadota bacterium]
MALPDLVVGKQQRPIRVVLYGVEGIGKSAFASKAPDPIFIATEDGTSQLDITRFPMANDWESVLKFVTLLLKEEHAYKTLVLDSLDWAERLCIDGICQQKKINSIVDLPYGNGYVEVAKQFERLVRGLDLLYKKGMHVILIAHAQIKTFNNPEFENYDRYQLKLYEKVASIFKQWCDCLLFANFETFVSEAGDGFHKRHIAQSYGTRVLYTEHRAAFDAKNRYQLPFKMELDTKKFFHACQ